MGWVSAEKQHSASLPLETNWLAVALRARGYVELLCFDALATVLIMGFIRASHPRCQDYILRFPTLCLLILLAQLILR